MSEKDDLPEFGDEEESVVDTAFLENAIVLDQILSEFAPLLEKYRQLGYNIGLCVHTYDPLSGSSQYEVCTVGDFYAVKGCLDDWLSGP